MAWTKFKDTDCGKVPDDVLLYVVKYVVKRGLRYINNVPYTYSYDDAISDCLVDAYYYNNVLCRPQYPITVNIGYLKKHVYARFVLRMKKIFDKINAEKPLSTLAENKRDSVVYDLIDDHVEKRADVETRELLKISKDIFRDWAAKQKNQLKIESVRRYFLGDTIRAIAKDNHKQYQYVSQIIIASVNEMKIEAIRRSSEKEQILQDLRAIDASCAIIADYIENPDNAYQLSKRLSKRFDRKFTSCQTQQEIKRALNKIY